MKLISKNLIAVSVVATLYTDIPVLSDDVSDLKNIDEHSISPSKSHQMINIDEYYGPSSSEFYSYIDYLCWKPITEKMTWAAKESYNIREGGQSGSEKYLAQTYDIALSYSSGFRIGVGYRFSQDYFAQNKRPFQLEANFERIYSSTSSSKKAKGVGAATKDDDGAVSILASQTLFTLLPSYLGGGVPGNAPYSYGTVNNPAFIEGNSHLKFGYNKGDISISWPLWIHNFMILRLYTGASFAYIESSWKTKFLQQSLPIADELEAYNTTSLKWNWRGGGLLGGIDTNIEFGRGFGFWANAAFSLMYGNAKQYEYYSSSLSGILSSPVYQIKSSRDFYSFQPLFKFGVGLNYKHWFKKVMLYSSAGWDFNYWVKLNQYGQSYITKSDNYNSRYFDVRTSSYLILEGLTARLGLDF